MVEEYFSDKDILKRLHIELESWMRTPYRHWAGVKKRGVDCIHLVIRSLEAVGAFQGTVVVIPKYPHDWHLHRGEPLLKHGLERLLPHVPILNKDEVKDGDVVLFKYGRQAAHSGIYYNGEVYQSMTGMGVHTRQYHDTDYYERIRFIYRTVKI
jgi:cell wall-associated NlpC family hydrolase